MIVNGTSQQPMEIMLMVLERCCEKKMVDLRGGGGGGNGDGDVSRREGAAPIGGSQTASRCAK